jgi:hypothetical protein
MNCDPHASSAGIRIKALGAELAVMPGATSRIWEKSFAGFAFLL